MKNYINYYLLILIILPHYLLAQELNVKEYFGHCSIVRKDSIIHVNVDVKITIDDEIIVANDSYIVLVPISNLAMEIPLATGHFYARDIYDISELNDYSIITFFQKVYTYFRNDKPIVSGLIVGAVTRSECVFTLIHEEFVVNNDCKKGLIQIIDTKNGEIVYNKNFVKKDEEIRVPFKDVKCGRYALVIAFETGEISYIIQKNENPYHLENIFQLEKIYCKKYIDFFYLQNCFWPTNLYLNDEFDN